MSDIDQDLAMVAEAVSSIIGSVEQAARVMAQACRRHPGFLSALHKKLKMQVSIAYLRRLERCGNGELHPELCLYIGQVQPFIEKLSLADQTRVIGGIAWPEGDTHRMRPLLSFHTMRQKQRFLAV